MRETKFRAFHRQEKRMMNVDHIKWNFVGEVISIYEYNSEVSASRVSIDGCILMQYTGLKDKNGKEIYEGDIVKVNIIPDKWDELTIIKDDEIMQVGYKGGSFSVIYSDKSEGTINTLISRYEFEVIGNIYENPELIKK